MNESIAAPAVPQESPLLTAEELAHALRCSRSWIYEAARDGRIPVIRVGSLKRFELASVLAHLRGNAEPTARLVHPLR